MTRLPLLDVATRACVSCHGPCCYEYMVPVSGFDLLRITSGLGVPWQSIVELVTERIGLHEGFRLDRGPEHHLFVLKRRESGACLFLVEIDESHRRCGVHALRPGPCRIYPLVASDAIEGAEFGGHAICPAPQAADYRAAVGDLRDVVDERVADRLLYERVLHRWDLLARFVPVERRLPVEAFVDWVGRLADAIAPLRVPERGEWQLRAYALVEEFPLPEVTA